MRATKFAAAGLLLCASVAFAAVKLSHFLPPNKALEGWAITKAADRGATDEQGLYGLYDGDVPHLQKYGIKAAHQRMYTKGEKRLIVDLMQFDTPKHARGLYEDRIKGMEKGKAVEGVKDKSLMTSANGVTAIYFTQGDYVGTISAFGASSGDKHTARLFAKDISGRIWKTFHPRPRRR